MNKKTGVIRLQSPFEKIKLSSDMPEVNLYRAIIMQMIIDASNTSQNPKLREHEEHAKEWLFGEGEALEITCENAMLSKHEVQKAAREAIEFHRKKCDLVI